MGLDTTHDCWHGPYSSFMAWRESIAAAAGYPPLRQMNGFGGTIDWELFKPDPLRVLLEHSDCEGEIVAADCGPLADRLEQFVPQMKDERYWHSDRKVTEQFIRGLRLAASRGENVEFH